MIRELQIIFGHHPVALGLHVARQRLKLLIELVGIAPGTIIDPVPATAAATIIGTIGTGPAASTTAAVVLTIVNQRLKVLVLVVS